MNSEDVILIEKYLSENISSQEKENLLLKLESSDEFKAEFKEAQNMKGLIYSATNDKALVVEVMNKVLNKDLDLEDKIMGRLTKNKVSNFSWILKAVAAAAIVFFIVKFSVDTVKTVAFLDKSPETIIKRTDSGNTDFSKLYINDIVQTGSTDEKISFNDGTKLNLKQKSELKVISEQPKVFKLSKGSISAEVTPQDKPMKIETSSATIEVLGTIFNLSSQEKNTLLKVKKGKVAITDKQTGERVEVTSGEYTIAEGKALQVRKGSGPLFVSDVIDQYSSKRYLDIDVNLEGESQLILISSNGGNGNNFDETAWLNPVINVNGIWTSLTKLKPKLIKVGKGEFKSYITKEQSDQLKVHNKSYVRGLYSHATSVLVWNLPKGTKSLKCRAAILDSSLDKNKEFSAKFEIYTEISKEILDFYMKKDKGF